MVTNPNQRSAQAQVRAQVDQGLRQYMLGVYNYMTLGLALTGLTAYFVTTSPELLRLLFTTPLQWVVIFAPLVFVFIFAARIGSMSLSAAQTCFWVYSAIMGLSLAPIFLVYTGASVARVFFITSGTFCAMSIYGYTTGRDLTQFGSFLFMGLIGIIIASVVNIWMQSSAVHFAVSILGVFIFIGLTAYDTQNIKNSYRSSDGRETAGKKAIFGALKLYLDFINLFVMLLRLFGDRR